MLAFASLFIAGGVANWLQRGTLSGNLAEYLATVVTFAVVGLAWFRAFLVELTADHVMFRKLWRRQTWPWRDIRSGYVARSIAPGGSGGFRPVFRVTLHHVDGAVMDIPYNVCGLQALSPLLDRLRRDGKIVHGPAEGEEPS